MEAKPARLSRTVLTEIILPADTNYHNTVFGGRVMQYIDKVATIASMRHSRRGLSPLQATAWTFMRLLSLVKLFNWRRSSLGRTEVQWKYS